MQQKISSKQERKDDTRKDDVKHEHNYHLHEQEVQPLIASNEHREQGHPYSRSNKTKQK